MSENLRKIKEELESLGYTTGVHDSAYGGVIEFDYHIELGSHAGQTVRMGVSMGDVDGGPYPEIPPHWLHITLPANDGLGGAIKPYCDSGRKWFAMSRPPADIWDRLPAKNMEHYINSHLRRFWAGT